MLPPKSFSSKIFLNPVYKSFAVREVFTVGPHHLFPINLQKTKKYSRIEKAPVRHICWDELHLLNAQTILLQITSKMPPANITPLFMKLTIAPIRKISRKVDFLIITTRVDILEEACQLHNLPKVELFFTVNLIFSSSSSSSECIRKFKTRLIWFKHQKLHQCLLLEI